MTDNFTFLNESGSTDYGGDEEEEEERSFSGPRQEEDFYAFLNVSRDATQDEIQMQYRKLSRIYHPDKHSNDPEAQVKAEKLFSKLKRIHEVLMDPEKRAIYDTLGTEGLLEAQQNGAHSMEIVTRYKTPMEIREEFERLQREKEEQRLERQANPKGTVTVNINASEIFASGGDEEDEEYYYDTGPYVELTGFHFFQSIDAPITTRDTIIMSGSVSAENGRGRGNIMGGLRKNYGRATAEVEVGGNTNGMDFGFKGYSMLGSQYYTNCSVACQSTAEGIRPALGVVLGRRIDEHSNGQVMWRWGGLGGLQTQYIWDNSVTRFMASVHVGLPHSFAVLQVSRKLEDKNLRLRALLKFGTFGAFTECGVEKKVSQLTSVSATMIVGVPLGVNLRIKILRSNQQYIFPIHLCDNILPAPIVYGAITPMVLWVVVNKLIVEPYERERKAREKAKLKAQNKTRMAEKKAEADGAVQLMKMTYARNLAEEEGRRGLIITSAKYGKLVSSGTEGATEDIIDVTIPLQCLIKDSKLILHETSKSNLPGFYDPIPWEPKSLLIQYLFRNKAHQVIVKDEEPITIPKESHQVPNTGNGSSSST